jgi:hypothetical protein
MLASRSIVTRVLLGGLGLCALFAVSCGGGGSNRDAGQAKDRADYGDVVIPKVEKDKIGDKVFDENQVQSYYLTFSDEEYAKLMDFSTLLTNPYTVNKDRYVQASLRVGDTELPAIAVRFKGNYSIWGCIDSVTDRYSGIRSRTSGRTTRLTATARPRTGTSSPAVAAAMPASSMG